MSGDDMHAELAVALDVGIAESLLPSVAVDRVWPLLARERDRAEAAEQSLAYYRAVADSATQHARRYARAASSDTQSLADSPAAAGTGQADGGADSGAQDAEPAPDRDALRDRIAEALQGQYGRVPLSADVAADAVLPVVEQALAAVGEHRDKLSAWVAALADERDRLCAKVETERTEASERIERNTRMVERFNELETERDEALDRAGRAESEISRPLGRLQRWLGLPDIRRVRDAAEWTELRRRADSAETGRDAYQAQFGRQVDEIHEAQARAERAESELADAQATIRTLTGMGHGERHGRCGHQPGAFHPEHAGQSYTCELPVGHMGYHREGDAEWSPSAPAGTGAHEWCCPSCGARLADAEPEAPTREKALDVLEYSMPNLGVESGVEARTRAIDVLDQLTERGWVRVADEPADPANSKSAASRSKIGSTDPDPPAGQPPELTGTHRLLKVLRWCVDRPHDAPGSAHDRKRLVGEGLLDGYGQLTDKGKRALAAHERSEQ